MGTSKPCITLISYSPDIVYIVVQGGGFNTFVLLFFMVKLDVFGIN